MLIKYMRRTHASLLTLITTQTRAMTTTCRNVDWRWLETTPSTMDAAKDLLKERGAADARPLAVATAHQTKGRGTRGRSWTDDGRGNVALTVAFPAPIPLKPVTLLPLRVGTLVIDALNDSRLSLKWPNDVLLEGGKVAGILVESDGDALFVGIGLNVASAPAVPSAGPDRGRRAAKIPGDAFAIAQSIADGLGAWSQGRDDATSVITDWSARADWTAEWELRETGELVKPVRLLPDGRLRVRGAGGERDLVADYLL
jgi:BirA family biotin operon repressor/biotin-[acetyl-CoA-carboxylase] ligase